MLWHRSVTCYWLHFMSSQKELLWEYFRSPSGTKAEKSLARQFDRLVETGKTLPRQLSEDRPRQSSEERKLVQRAYRSRNRPLIRSLNAAWKAKNPERFAALQKAWVARNKSKVHQWKMNWKKRNPEKVKAAQDRCNAKRKILNSDGSSQVAKVA